MDEAKRDQESNNKKATLEQRMEYAKIALALCSRSLESAGMGIAFAIQEGSAELLVFDMEIFKNTGEFTCISIPITRIPDKADSQNTTNTSLN